uniref:Glycosyltransferase n=1 Tax=viral metagenome TaxID=1070528 RepID=A0A6C0LKN0_9ZZZZ
MIEKYTYNIYLMSSVIKKNVYLTWGTLDFSDELKENINTLKERNPEFKFHIYDDKMCRDFIAKHFSKNVLFAYDNLIPGAYKADLWRYCILFMNGGIYMDIKLCTIPPFKLIDVADGEYLVSDRPPNTIYNAFMVCKPHNLLLKCAISKIIYNVKNKVYGTDPLDPTGPRLLGTLMTTLNRVKKKNIKCQLSHYNKGGFITFKNKFVLTNTFHGYKKMRNNYYTQQNTAHYDTLWRARKIYK